MIRIKGLAAVLLFGFAVVSANAAEVCFYDNANYSGLLFCNSADDPDLASQYHDTIESVTVPAGYVLVTYSSPNYVGPLSGDGGDDNSLVAWERAIRSYQIKSQAEAGVCFYKNPNFRVLRFCTFSTEPTLDSQYFGQLKSINLPENFEVTTYSEELFINPIATYSADDSVFDGAELTLKSFTVTNFDSDFDLVLNSNDACPNTPVGEAVDTNGCSQSQLGNVDSDGDGIPDDQDAYPHQGAQCS